MGEPHIYEENAPDGYTEHIAYNSLDKVINTPEWNMSEWADIKLQGKQLAREAEHQVILYPNMSAPAAAAKAEPKGIFKSNLSGDVPSSMLKGDDDDSAAFLTNELFRLNQKKNKPTVIIGQQAIDVSNQEKLFNKMVSAD
jgi:hypothetical protein